MLLKKLVPFQIFQFEIVLSANNGKTGLYLLEQVIVECINDTFYYEPTIIDA